MKSKFSKRFWYLNKNSLLFKDFSKFGLNHLPAHHLWDTLIYQTDITETELLKWAHKTYSTPLKRLNTLIIDTAFLKEWDLKDCLTNNVLPIYNDTNCAAFAVANPFNPYIETIKKKLSKDIQLYLVPKLDILKFFQTTTDTNQTELDRIITYALTEKASDIHISETATTLSIQFRIHGKLFHRETIEDKETFKKAIKYHSHMDIALANHPQDGRIQFEFENSQIDIRVASLPTVYGEDFVLRLFSTETQFKELDSLGLSEEIQTELIHLTKEPNGLILVTGPTGSGKTTTLYALLREIQKSKTQNIVTLEDPVERILPGIRQSQINPKNNYDFKKGLKAILRQDPDTIMIGEIRDLETAKTALESAYTGHLVLSTLHTQDVKSTLLRLANFELDPFLVSHSLKGILSQKLVPTPCPNCQTGCSTCQYSGITGRTVQTELLRLPTPIPVTDLKSAYAKFLKDGHFIPFKNV